MKTTACQILLRFTQNIIRRSLYTLAFTVLLATNGDAASVTPSISDATSSPVLEVGGRCVQVAATIPVAACHPANTPPAVSRVKIVSYNIRWRSGDELQEIIQKLKADAEIGGAVVIGLQEVDRNRKRSQKTNTARVIAEALGMNYTWTAPPHARSGKRSRPETPEDETGVALLSPYPMTDVASILLPHAGPGGRRRVALGATIHLGATQVRAYSIHAETRISVAEKIDQLKAVLDDLARFPKEMRAVVLGDFNTWQPDSKRDTIRLFADAGFATPFPPGQPTFRHMLVRFRLDWIWLRGFAPATAHGIARHIEISDHYPLWLETEMKASSER